METLDVLVAARAEVEKGWCKNMAVDPRGNVCALGAIETAIGVEKSPRVYVSFTGEAHEARDAMRGVLPAGYPHVPAFNDDPQTTKADVIELFTRAINAEAVKVTADPAHTYTVAA